MINIYGIDFEDDEVQISYIDGVPEWVLSPAGVRRMAAMSPDQEKAARFLVWFDEIEANWKPGGQGAH